MWSRAAMASFLLGLGIGGAQYYILHQDVWNSTENMLNLFSHRSNLLSKEEERDIRSQPTQESLEVHLRNKAVTWWNRSLDALENRLVRLPDSFQQLSQDTKATVQKMTESYKSK
ncbi:hypothetical protein GpartN1_g4369.t1 [Galdieria partita]|uniref:Uncharacterized protein n=1 Tax=Galdieria partita TaxID=83374 RepID=A0A9C7UR51_9RHOD|nr:hypothetical protein GpartN1_g4174.t1 [Galdieria partita]GJQ12578.1 hypothetical protein GpartN1_g4369.t1 [Galdieria partita]